MTLKKSIGIGAIFIIMVCLCVIFSYQYMNHKLTNMQVMENTLLERDSALRKGNLELNIWLDQMAQHAIEGWPFEGELDHASTKHVHFLEGYTVNDEAESKMMENLQENHHALHEKAKIIVQTADEEEKMDLYLDEFKPFANAVAPLIGGIANIMQQKLQAIRDERIKLQKQTGYFILAACLLILGCILVATYLLFNKVLKPIGDVSEKIMLFGEGNLDVNINYKGKNEIGEICDSFNTMAGSLRNIVQGILTSSDQVLTAVDILRQRADKTAEGTQKQQSQSAQAAVASEEMSQTILDISQNATVASESTSNAMSIANEGQTISEGAIETVNSVHASTSHLAEMVEQLNSRVSEISNILTLINDIADQTNLLALNAAIEAARAGEQGRGFAVVADEVRKLAERTISATAEITGQISAVQKEASQTTQSMGEASEKVTQAAEYIKDVGSSLQNIVESVSKVSDEVMQIAASVEEQSAASEEVTSSVTQTSEIAENLKTMSDDVIVEVNDLMDIASRLRSYTTGFKFSKNEQDNLSGNTGVLQSDNTENLSI